MDYNKLKEKYEELDYHDYKLRTIDDIETIYSINMKELKGYSNLPDKQKRLFNSFIVNYYNAQGLVLRHDLTPKSINYVEEVIHYGKDKDNVNAVVRIEFFSIGNDGYKKPWFSDDMNKGVKRKTIKRQEFLRFDYHFKGKNEWIHVLNDTDWY